jgi:mannose-6-phosphate isomerase
LHVSRVIDGPNTGRDLNDLWENSRQQLTGQQGSGSFPLLVKWLECNEFLSLQVHPDDRMAQRVLNEPFGKTEAWVVVSAEPTARIFAGLKPGITRSDVLSHLEGGTLADCLHSFVPKPGDCISLPAGTVHAAGGGLIIAEVQQSSDATFRLFDWNRLGLDGKPRPLQIERALEAVDWKQGPVSPVTPTPLETRANGVQGELLVNGPLFRFERYTVQQSLTSPYAGEFTIWMLLDGQAELVNLQTGYQRKFVKGAMTVIPATVGSAVWNSASPAMPLKLLCVRIPSSSI